MTYIMTREEIRQAVGHLMICGFAGQTLDAETKEIMREVQPLGLILFARNIASSAQVAELNRELKMHRPNDPVLLSVDQEGGRVARLKDAETRWPPMRRLGDCGDANLAYAVGQALARELRATNFDIDFAPVLDVDTNPNNPIIGDRSFSRKASEVGKLGAALTQGLQDHGVGACGKHFPGHGDTDTDSHLDLPKVSHSLERLRQVEWPPFEAAIQAGLGAIMTAHVVVEALGQEPATLSSTALRTHLRQELKFEGVIVSDDIDMKAVADRYSPRDIGVQGLKAGCDVFLACRDPAAMLALYRGLVQAVESEEISHGMLLTAAKRARAWRTRYYRAPIDSKAHQHWLGARAHQELADRLRQQPES
jgi:beta-N-acetylhexosaminidase